MSGPLVIDQEYIEDFISKMSPDTFEKLSHVAELKNQTIMELLFDHYEITAKRMSTVIDCVITRPTPTDIQDIVT